MGCAQSVPVAPPIERIPTPEDLTTPFQKVHGFPQFTQVDDKENNDLVQSEGQIQFLVMKTNKSAKGDAFRVKDTAINENGGNDDWLGDRGIFVEPVPVFGMIRKNMESWSGLYRGKEAKPLGFWICDPSRGVNTFNILKETPSYDGQPCKTYTGRDQGEDSIYATPFKGRTSVDLYQYAQVVFDMHTTLVNIRVFGAPKCHGPEETETPYRMRQGNESTWVLYKWRYDTKEYKECALLVQSYQTGVGKFSGYTVTISPGEDVAFITLTLTLLDHFWEYRIKKAIGVKFY